MPCQYGGITPQYKVTICGNGTIRNIHGMLAFIPNATEKSLQRHACCVYNLQGIFVLRIYSHVNILSITIDIATDIFNKGVFPIKSWTRGMSPKNVPRQIQHNYGIDFGKFATSYSVVRGIIVNIEIRGVVCMEQFKLGPVPVERLFTRVQRKFRIHDRNIVKATTGIHQVHFCTDTVINTVFNVFSGLTEIVPGFEALHDRTSRFSSIKIASLLDSIGFATAKAAQKTTTSVATIFRITSPLNLLRSEQNFQPNLRKDY